MSSHGRRMLKILLLGDANVGKTPILNQVVNREFTSQYSATIGSDFSKKQMDIDGKPITLHIWDTAGQERFQSLGPTFYRGTDCCVLIYDVTKPESFESIKKWRKEFILQSGISNEYDFPFLLLGNNFDHVEKAVEESTAREFALNNGNMLFYEASSKTGKNIIEAFDSQSCIKMNIKWKTVAILVENDIYNFIKILLGKLK